MRLTLRTLLAYLDDILDPSDQEELRQKVESSEFAGELIHRTRDTMRRLRLSAPQVMGAGIGLDPNTVAEYLDNTLSPDSVADLERVCLESDIHLAEVASCHHVLTMVLGEPAEIERSSRERMYRIAEELEARKQPGIEGAHATTEAAPDGAMAATGPLGDAATSVEVPDYLRASDWSGPVRALSAIAAVLVLAGIFYLGMQLTSSGGGDEGPLASNQLADAPSSVPPAAAIADEPVADEPVAQEPAADEPVADEPAAEQPADGVAPIDHTTPTPPGETLSPAASAAVVGERYAPAEPGSEQTTTRSTIDDLEGPDGLPSLDQPFANIPPLPTTPDQPFATLEDGSVAAGDQTIDQPLPGEVSEATDETSPEDEPPPPPTELGNYWGDQDVLLRYDEQRQEWHRLDSGASVQSGNRLLTLPTFRSTMALSSGVGVTLSGATLVRMHDAPLADDDIPLAEDDQQSGAAAQAQIELVYGRLLLMNPTSTPSSLALKVGGTTTVVELGSDATLAVEVKRSHVPGRDPLESPAAIEATAHAPYGNVTWTSGETSLAIDPPASWSVPTTADGKVELKPLDDSIEWLVEEPTSRLERLAASELASRLSSGVAADTVLLEVFYEGRRREVKALAAQSSVYVGQFGPFIDALGDSDQRSSWDAHIETLRFAMALSPVSAEKIYQALVDLKGKQEADDLFEMLRGYTPEQIGTTPEARQTGALDKLITWLEDDRLEYRVLAAYNLREITGKNLLPNPAGSISDRAQGVRRWRQRLKSGEL